jgi:F0F1-type ATP synthase alpha subunit
VTNGFIDEVPQAKVREWEASFHEFMAREYPQVGERLRAEKALSKDVEETLKQGLAAFKKSRNET